MVMDDKITRKIKALLATAEHEATNENLAHEALMKARELMLKHKIAESDVKPAAPEIVKKYTAVALNTFYICSLFRIIADNYGVIALRQTVDGQKRGYYFGFGEDAETAMLCFEFAAGFMLSSAPRAVRAYVRERGLRSSKGLKKSYCIGFAKGIQEKFETQNAGNTEYALITQVPQEVQEAHKAMKTRNVKSRADTRYYAGMYQRGHDDALNMDNKRLSQQSFNLEGDF
jgi:hypothetical protein